MNDTPLSPWIIVKKTGIILATHYNCMAGLPESCSHIGAVLFYIEYATRIHDSKACTEEKGYRLLPGYHSVEYKEVCSIDFSAAKTLKKTLEAKVVNYTDTENAPVTNKNMLHQLAMN